MGFGNRMAIVVLRSPLHRMMSKSLLVLTYTGRRSGKRYEIPLQYVEEGGTLYVWAGNAATKTWWRNFETPSIATLQLRGRVVAAKGSLVDNVDRRAAVLRAYVDRYPYTRPTGRPKFFGERWHPTAAELTEVAASIVVVALEPE